jgi:hypothetical protein
VEFIVAKDYTVTASGAKRPLRGPKNDKRLAAKAGAGIPTGFEGGSTEKNRKTGVTTSKRRSASNNSLYEETEKSRSNSAGGDDFMSREVKIVGSYGRGSYARNYFKRNSK